MRDGRRLARSTAIVSALLLILLTGLVSAHADVQNLVVQPGQAYTVAISLTNGDQVTGSLSITGGSGNDVNFWVTDPSGATIENLGRVSQGGSFQFSAVQSGGYTLHIDNSFSILSSKQVTLTYNVAATAIPGVSPTDSLYVIALVVILLIVIVAAVRKARKGKAAP